MGPLLAEAALENYLKLQGIAVREGCEEVMRGKHLERETKGYYVSPSIHLVHRPDAKSVYQKNEVIGPNVAIYRVSDLEETIELLNQPQLGLAGAAYTGAREIYLRLAEEARVGMFHWNRPTVTPAYRLVFGGLKKSGNARPMGRFSSFQCTYPVSSWEAAEQAPSYPETLPRPEKEKKP
jgi:succinylglutamic semialdehyde dehydrogenase